MCLAFATALNLWDLQRLLRDTKTPHKGGDTRGVIEALVLDTSQHRCVRIATLPEAGPLGIFIADAGLGGDVAEDLRAVTTLT